MELFGWDGLAAMPEQVVGVLAEDLGDPSCGTRCGGGHCWCLLKSP
jgi:hypothetical protein